MTAWLTVIGIGDDGIENLPSTSRAIVETADVIAGSARVLDAFSDSDCETILWKSPFKDSLEQLLSAKGRNIVVLATGDPMHFGIGSTLARHIAPEEMTVIPSPSAFSLAAARLKWPLQHLDTLSLHGRPVSLLHPFVQPSARLIALTGGGKTVHEAAQILRDRGFGPSILAVLVHMGGPEERATVLSADECSDQEFADFNTLAIECVAGPNAQVLPRVPGLPDEAFVHDGQLTKREMRAVTLAALGPTPGAVLWDVGAGCGSVAIEWMRAARGCEAVAFERDQERIKMIAQNAVALGAPGLDIVQGDVETSLDGNEPPHAIFQGGAVANEEVFAACWKALPTGGRLVANAVTLEGEAALIARHEKFGGELVRIDISHASTVGSRRAMRPRMAVTQWRVTKE